ncbi:hypothetical protein JRQ81_003939 [Phrynocephalus forsythii]|uniref:IF rod domain-containing protein n=1 Tax=Phrynocephalus forsythii TaxID=171643 RepID=A0A9Q1AXE3_9SAUR|nr:hypothetical protein JRQ81_003939 [Phrynocephalus forsythii]
MAAGSCLPPQCHYGYQGYDYCGNGYRYGFQRSGVCAPCCPSITSVVRNEALLQPLNVEIDATAQAAKCQEKNELQCLNSQFASFIGKVRYLEQLNLMLHTKLEFLQQKKGCRSIMEPMLNEYISSLKKELECLECENAQLVAEMNHWRDVMEGNKKRFEEECHHRTSAENEYVTLKKEVDCVYMDKAEKEAKVMAMQKSLLFFKNLFGEELNELQCCISDTCVTVQMDNSRGLNMDCALEEFRRCYEDIASRSRSEVEAWCQCEYQELQTTAAKHCDNLRCVKEELCELRRSVQRLEAELSSVRAQRCKLEEEVASAEQRGEMAVKDAKCKLAELEDALHKAKQDMTCLVREYQELMAVKLGRDLEMCTYRKLLDGEECRLGEGECAVNISVQRNQGAVVCNTDSHPVCGPRGTCGPSGRIVANPCAAPCAYPCPPCKEPCPPPRGFSCGSGRGTNIRFVAPTADCRPRY